ncbi:protein translocase subunit SecD [Brochothrix thermosphacta]|uniref:protein translocase subunit SecD n=1 Tax=Brochothrix thermosphacta TaxID=2756 RepID=UPI00083FD896|nr:protein translocase subunit SecD [Brochothrix thermosphacta]ODJ57582.1 protein translocase subunit SecDF [Brochothrix thermosphacta]ODJ60503.1 protein translocase subunit SecDF [Brochothrix thermosphacta]ODJ64803.1 protein translocase subunit SecDF [Brochothrix thermosphacta]ODJ65111.1 protein translocase subunit SecDF [Brochothrix thermosphacta]ODJ72702.1 protein translocase subunit SecDF [Brochothrix thermosphacta]
MMKRGKLVSFFILIAVFTALISFTVKPVLNNINLGLDLQGGFEVLYEVKPAGENAEKVTSETLKSTVVALDKRINALGVAEPSITIESGNRIRVQLAGVKDQDEAREMLSTTAQLSFRDANDKLMMDGRDLVQGAAKQSFDQQNQPVVTLKLKDSQKFADVTKKILAEAPNNQLVIWLDHKDNQKFLTESKKENPAFLSAPNVSQVLNTNQVEISGSFTVAEANNLAELLNAGALPVKLTEVYSTSVGAAFGQSALQDTMLAGLIGLLAIFVFMLIFYRLPGLIASVTLSIYTYIVLLIVSLVGATMTLPGIAGLILGIGMAVDANIITYERIKEEIRVGRTIKKAFVEGSKESFRTILDANLTTIIVAGVLFVFGTSSIRGFALILIISILVSFITAVYGSRIMLGLIVNSGFLDNRPGWFAVKRKSIHNISEGYESYKLATNFDNIDFLKHRKVYLSIFAGIVIAGIICLATLKMNLGIDFSSGTRAELTSDKTLTAAKITKELDQIGMPSNDIVLTGKDQKSAVVSYKGAFSQDEIKKFNNHFKKEYGHESSINTVTPTVGQELAKNGFFALIIASLLIIVYIGFRFELKMAVSAVISLLFDGFVIFVVFSIFKIQVDLTFIAAVLTVIGYSINDTIVTADRVREIGQKLRVYKNKEDLAVAVNQGLRQTLTRSLATVFTVLITVTALMIFGSHSIWEFSLALMIGLVSSIFTSMFMVMQMWYGFKVRELNKHGEIKTVKEKKYKSKKDKLVV